MIQNGEIAPAQLQLYATHPQINFPKTKNYGIVTAVSAGTATRAAPIVDGNISATCRISVQNVAFESISLNKSNTTIHIGKNETLTATVSPTNATNKNISWNSSNPSVATVSSGIITARASGTAVITATADGGKSYSCTVIVTDHDFAGT